VPKLSKRRADENPANLFIIKSLLVLVFCIAAVLGGCAVKLAPDYDKAIFDGLAKANTDAMTLFASTSSGPYSDRQAAYDSVVGQLNAVQVQIKSRGTPASPLLAGLFVPANARHGQQQASGVLASPTAASVNALIKIVERTRKEDSQGRIKNRIDFDQEAFAIQMAQALAYEKALQR
jgi:hypothetical protein